MGQKLHPFLHTLLLQTIKRALRKLLPLPQQKNDKTSIIA
jgi:hypothetical protein